MLTAAEHHHDHDQHDQDQRNDPTHLHPARCTRIAAARSASRRSLVSPSGVRGRSGVCHMSSRAVASARRCHSVVRDETQLSTIEIWRVYSTDAYPGDIPSSGHETIKAHRREVHEAILDTAAALVARSGLRAVTMSQIAQETGIGRATLYKYFSGVEPILIAWHDRHVANHLERLSELRNQLARLANDWRRY